MQAIFYHMLNFGFWFYQRFAHFFLSTITWQYMYCMLGVIRKVLTSTNFHKCRQMQNQNLPYFWHMWDKEVRWRTKPHVWNLYSLDYVKVISLRKIDWCKKFLIYSISITTWLNQICIIRKCSMQVPQNNSKHFISEFYFFFACN